MTTFTFVAKAVRSFLLKEDSYYLLLEDGGKILVEPITGTDFSSASKSATAWTFSDNKS